MDKKTEALKLALEALEYIHEGANNQGPHTGISWRCVSNKAESAITALREALAEQPAQQEPVGTVQCINGVTIGYLDVMQPVGTKLYTSSQPAQPRKPLPFNKEDMEGLDVNQRLGFKLGWKSAEEAHGIKENT